MQIGGYQNESYYTPNIGYIQEIAVQEAKAEGVGGGIDGGIYSGVLTHMCGNAAEANAAIDSIIKGTAKEAGLVNVFQLPVDCGLNENNEPSSYNIQIEKPYATIAGYAPANNKLFTYPYKYLEVDNMEGAHAEYQYEFFNTLPPGTDGGSCVFEMNGYVLSRPERLLVPLNYKGIERNLNECVNQSHFPTCPYSTDIYKATLAQQNANLPLSVARGVLGGAIAGVSGGAMTSGAVGAVGGGLLGAVGGAISPIANTLMGNLVRPEQGVSQKGAGETDIVSALHDKHFHFYGKCITRNYATMIDDYFTAFGYAIRNNQIPNMNARPLFTYVKTIGAIVTGELPADHAAQICAIFDKGVRFWAQPGQIGNLDGYANK